MTSTTRIVLPGAEYLAKIGQIIYMMGDLEWTVLGDLPRLGNPGGLTIEGLVGKTTTKLGEKLVKDAATISDAAIQSYVSAGGQILLDLAERRNGVVHARPTTGPDGQPVLYRWRAGGAPEAYTVTAELLDKLIADIDAANTQLAPLRVAAAAAAGNAGS